MAHDEDTQPTQEMADLDMMDHNTLKSSAPPVGERAHDAQETKPEVEVLEGDGDDVELLATFDDEDEEEKREIPEPMEPQAAWMGDLALPNVPMSELPVGSDPLSHYLARLRHIEPLPPQEQQALAIQYKEHDNLQAAQRLILTNLRLVVKIAREYQRRWANLLDLIQEGNVGLSEAVKRYDPYRGVKFTSYAQYWIRAMILNYLMNHFQPVKIGSTRAGRKLFYNLKKAREQLRRQGYMATPQAIAEMLGVKEAEVIRVSEYLDAPPLSIDSTAPGHEKTTYGELLPADVSDPEEEAAEGEVNSQLQGTIKAFGEGLTKDRERAIWFERMISEDPKSLIQLGNEYGVSKERIRQVEAQIRSRFKTFLLSRHGEEVQFEFIQN